MLTVITMLCRILRVSSTFSTSIRSPTSYFVFSLASWTYTALSWRTVQQILTASRQHLQRRLTMNCRIPQFCLPCTTLIVNICKDSMKNYVAYVNTTRVTFKKWHFDCIVFVSSCKEFVSFKPIQQFGVFLFVQHLMNCSIHWLSSCVIDFHAF